MKELPEYPREDMVGWFDHPSQKVPVHDPGLVAKCPVCVKLLEAPLVTISLMLDAPEARERSYFFRAHKQCWNGTSEHEQGLIESSIIDREAKRLKRKA